MKETYTSLLDAPINEDLVVLEVADVQLGTWLQRMGIFADGHLTRHDEEINYHPVRIRADLGEVVIPAGLALKIFVHTDELKKPLVEMEKGESGHVEAMTCGKGCVKALEHLGLKDDTEVTFIRSLPHMDYITVIDRKDRTRLSEGEAARIWGHSPGQKSTQFYFARRKQPFKVEEIIGGRKLIQHLTTHGVYAGAELSLESIAPVQEMHAPDMEHITISSPGGLRMYLTPMQAGQIVVKSLDRKLDEIKTVAG
ncbi:MAG: hypothetical protein CSB24_02915 [Deltaproteobacteria bacterium]|nr:MAG: hypothetical protein CSB24_02915 [Deltaproteobacteria bacterium]